MKRPPLRAVLLFASVALVSGALVGWLTRDRIPKLTAERLAEARATWARDRPPAYDLELEIEGSELAKGAYVVAVRAGGPPQVTRNGVVATGDPAVYTVEGLLETLAEEIALAADPQRTFGAPAGYHAYLYAKFDERGVPVRYRRVVGGDSRWSEWTVVSLKPR